MYLQKGAVRLRVLSPAGREATPPAKTPGPRKYVQPKIDPQTDLRDPFQ